MPSAQPGKSDTSKFCFQILITAVLCYVGSYYLLVGKQVQPSIKLWDLHSSPGSDPQYLWDGSVLHSAYAPIHWIDRRIRNEYWGPAGVVWEEPDLSQFEPH